MTRNKHIKHVKKYSKICLHMACVKYNNYLFCFLTIITLMGHLGDNCIVFEDLLASMVDLMVAN